jgi:hypothetical protein
MTGFVLPTLFAGNLHLNVIAKNGYRPELEAALEPFIYELVGAFWHCPP